MKERELLQQIASNWGTNQVVCFVGDGGIGKTRLLEEVGAILQKCPGGDRCCWSGILDFYHVEIRSGSGIERALMRTMDPERQFFTKYREERFRYENLRASGGDPQALGTLRSQLRGIFIQDFNQFAKHVRCVLCFDTVELVQYETDLVQRICESSFQWQGRREHLGEAGGWLLEVLPKLDNTVVLLSGRPSIGPFQKRLDEALAGRLVSRLLGPFNPEETLQYLDALAETLALGQDRESSEALIQIKAAVQDSIYRVTQGEPLSLAMIVAMLHQGTIRPDDLVDLKPDQVPAKSSEWIRECEYQTMGVLSYINLLRKGVDAELLQRIVGNWDKARCRETLEQMQRFVFVKRRPGTDLLFLHDKMYEWIDSAQHPSGFVKPEDLCPQVIAYYQDRIDQSPEQADVLRIEQLYYRLLQDGEAGFRHYQQLSDAALSGGQFDVDMNLRNELLRFFQPRYPGEAAGLYTPLGRRIARDNAVRWMVRFLRQSKHEQARSLADCIRSYGKPPFDRQEPSLFEPAVQVYRGEALIYLGQVQAALEELAQAVRELEQPTPAGNEEDTRQYLMGMAHKNRGYAYTRQRGYGQAIQEYQAAIDILDPLARRGLHAARLEAAHTKRNLAFVHGEQGEENSAKGLCAQALADFQELEYRWGEALTLNVYGEIEARFHDPVESERHCEEALHIFTTLNDQRGIGLSKLGLGRAERRLAQGSGPEDQAYSEILFGQAEQYLQEAETIFRNQVSEPIRLVEAIAERGKLYRDWTKARSGKRDQVAASETLLQEAIRQADGHSLLAERMDYRQDLANLYQSIGQYDPAMQILVEAERLLPPNSVLSQECPFPKLQCSVLGHLEILGKIYMTRGDIAHAQGDLEEATRCWTLASGYFHAFSANSVRLDELALSVGKKLSIETSARLRALLERCLAVERECELQPTRLQEELRRWIGRIERSKLRP